MERTGKNKVLFFAALAATAFLANFCWESVHGLLYLAHPEMHAARYVPMMLSMAVMDTGAIALLYLFTALVARNWFWRSEFRNNLMFFLAALAAAALVEYIALFSLHLWHYGPSMPLFFGVGIFPLFQFVLTGFLSVFVARKVAPAR